MPAQTHVSSRRLFDRRSKTWLFVFEGLGSLACGFYANYIFFLLRDQHGFGHLGNLGVAAMQGLVFATASWRGGRFAQRHGCFTALRTGLLGMGAALGAGLLLPELTAQLVVLVVWTAFMGCVWPALEALVSEGETAHSLPRTLGIYNVVWATCAAFSYFLGGALFEQLKPSSIYWLPMCAYGFQLLLLNGLASRPNYRPSDPDLPGPSAQVVETVALPQTTSPRTFQRMAWLANPFACIGINTLLAMIPGRAEELDLSTAAAGWLCSAWFFGRLAAFILLWRWTGWHFRLPWLLGAFVGLMGGFVAVLVAHELWLLLVAQVVFGLSVGVLYYSSLYYSMAVGDTRAEHGGVHEAMMGLGGGFGPAIGATALLFWPRTANVSAYAVSVLLAVGLLGLLGLLFQSKQQNKGVFTGQGQRV